MSAPRGALWKRIRRWYDGEFFVDSSTHITILGRNFSRSARIARALVAFWLEHWKQIITWLLALPAVTIATIAIYRML